MDLEGRDDDFAGLIAGEAPRDLKLPDVHIEQPKVFPMLGYTRNDPDTVSITRRP